jgi:hypothetical protein
LFGKGLSDKLSLLGRPFVRAEVGMVALDTPLAGKIPVAFDLSRMAGIAGFGLAGLALIADNRIDLSLRKVGDGSSQRGTFAGS